eukprot:6193984-Pleurochrysis_carterae.AAC.1
MIDAREATPTTHDHTRTEYTIGSAGFEAIWRQTPNQSAVKHARRLATLEPGGFSRDTSHRFKPRSSSISQFYR